MKMKKLLLSLGAVAAVAAPVATVVACSSNEVTTIYNQFSIGGLDFQKDKNPAPGTESKLFVVNSLGNNTLVKSGTNFSLVPTAKLSTDMPTGAVKVASTKGIMMLVDEAGKKLLAAGKVTPLLPYATKAEFSTAIQSLLIKLADKASDDKSTDTIINYSQKDLEAAAKAYQAHLVEGANAGTPVDNPIIAADADVTKISDADGKKLMELKRQDAIDAIFNANSGR